MPLPLLPLQILWMNLVTDGLPGLALGFEPPEPDVMQRPPHPPDESIFARGLGTHILWAGPLMGLVALLTGWAYWRRGRRSLADDALHRADHLADVPRAWPSVRSASLSSRAGSLSNRLLLGAVLLTILLQFALIYVPFLQDVFGLVALDLTHIVIAFVISSAIFWIIEGQKWVSRIRERRAAASAGSGH